MNPSQTAPIGVLLAAGRGRRMGRTKQLLPWPTDDGEKPLVAAAFDAIARVCREMVVVLGHEADAVAAALGDRAFRKVSSNPDAPMFESVRVGLREALRYAADAHVLLQPADHPAVRPDTLDALFLAAADHPDRAVIPELDGKGGHPVLIPARLIGELLRFDGSGGLQAYWARHREQWVRIPVDDQSIVLNINTAADFQFPGRSER